MGNGEWVQVRSRADEQQLKEFLHSNPTLYSAPGQGATENQIQGPESSLEKALGGTWGFAVGVPQGVWQGAKSLYDIAHTVADNPTAPTVQVPNPTGPGTISVKNPAGETPIIPLLYNMWKQQAKQGFHQALQAPTTAERLLGIAASIPGFEPQVHMAEEGHPAQAIGQVLGQLGAYKGIPEGIGDVVNKGIPAIAEDPFGLNLTRPTRDAAMNVINAHSNALAQHMANIEDMGDARVGDLVQQLSDADRQAQALGNRSGIHGGRAVIAAREALENTKQLGDQRPSLTRFLDEHRNDGLMSFDEAKQARSEAGTMWAQAHKAAIAGVPGAGADATALAAYMKKLGSDMAERANELGLNSEYNEYNDIHRAKMSAQKGPWGTATDMWRRGQGNGAEFANLVNDGASETEVLKRYRNAVDKDGVSHVDTEPRKMARLQDNLGTNMKRYAKYLPLQTRPSGYIQMVTNRPIFAGTVGLGANALVKSIPFIGSDWLSRALLRMGITEGAEGMLDKIRAAGYPDTEFGKPQPARVGSGGAYYAQKEGPETSGSPEEPTPPVSSTGGPGVQFQWPQLYGETLEGGTGGAPGMGPGRAPTPQGPGQLPALPSGTGAPQSPSASPGAPDVELTPEEEQLAGANQFQGLPRAQILNLLKYLKRQGRL